jgi:hypothetical protein
MQYGFSLNNFDVSLSVSNPGDGVSEVVLSSYQSGKNQTEPKQNKKKTPQSILSSNAISCSKFFSMQV